MEIKIGIAFGRPESQPRTDKGSSLLKFLKDYTVIDLETTGLVTAYNDIIEMSAIRVRDGEVSETFTSLAAPHREIDEFIVQLTGITNEMVSGAPSIEEILPSFLEFIGGDVLVGHNINFDYNFIYDKSKAYLKRTISNDYVDTMRISRYAIPALANYKLETVSDALGVEQRSAHRALDDCNTTMCCYKALERKCTASGIDLELIHRRKRSPRAKDFESDKDASDSPIYDCEVVVTGRLESMTRSQFMQFVSDHGGLNRDTVTKKTKYLVLGNNDYCSSITDGKSSKQKKAEQLMIKGQDLAILDEETFFDMFVDHDAE